MSTQDTPRAWYKLDNAGKIYPAIETPRWNPLFRLSVTLREPVDPARLQRALLLTLPRFPHVRSRLRRGIFWYYFEDNPGMPRVQEDVKNPCMAIDVRKNSHFRFRVRYHEYHIAVEIFHAITDGSGCLIFLKTLTAQYLRLGGANIPCEEGVLDCKQLATPDELEDSYNRFAKLDIHVSRRESKAWHVPGDVEESHVLHVTTGVMTGSAVVREAKSRGVSVTDLLTAVLVYALHSVQLRVDPHTKKKIKVSVPVNMRPFYSSQTLRNFSLFVNVGIDPRYGAFTFDEILHHVHHSLKREVTPRYLNSLMAMNVTSERNPVLRVVPLFVKKVSLIMAFGLLGERQFSSTLSNLGVVKLPEAMKPYVERFDMILGPPRSNHIVSTVITYGDTMTVNFTRDMVESHVERIFFTHLIKMGIPVAIESNQMSSGKK